MGNPLHELSLEQLRRRTSQKWRRYPPDVLPAWVAEMDVPLAEPVVTALNSAVALGDTGYADGDVYAEALAVFAKQRWGWTVPLDRTAIVPDVMLGSVELFKLVTGYGDAVVINPPVYPPFYQFIEHLDRRVVEAPLNDEHRLDLDTLERAFRDAVAGGRRGAYLLCSPHNPTGTVHSAAELSAVAQLANDYGVSVVADEIHAPIVPAGASFVPYLTVPGSGRGFSLLSASKAWNLSGAKAALAVAGDEAAGDLARMPEEVSHGVSHLGVISHAAGLRDGGPWLDDVLRGLAENRVLLADLLSQHLPAVRYRAPQGTYLAWLDCRALGLGADPAAAFLRDGRVALSPGPRFGAGGAGHARLNIATSPEILADAVGRMRSAVA